MYRYLLILPIVFSPITAHAAQLIAGDQPSLPSTVRVMEDVYMAGGTVTSAATVIGDVSLAGGNIIMSGSTTADVLAAGGSISILGDVGDDVRAAGGTILVQGNIAGDLVLAGGQLTLAGGMVGGDFLGTGGTIRIDAPVAGNVRIAGGNIVINAPIGGNVEITGERVTLASEAAIQGTLTYKAPQELTQEAGAVVQGGISYTPVEDVRGQLGRGAAAVAGLWFIARFLMLFAGALIIGLLFPRLATEVARGLQTEPLKNFGIGVVALIVIPIVSVFLMITVIGLPLGALGLLGFAALMIFLHLFAPVVVGSFLMRWIRKRELEVTWLTIILGVVAYFILGLIPFIGWFARLLIILAILGMVVRMG